MNRQLLKIFPVPVGIIDNFISEQERLLILKEITSTDHSDHHALSGEASSTHSLKCEVIDDISRKFNIDIIERINKEVNEFVGVSGMIPKSWKKGISRLMIDNSWSNIQSKGSTLRRHTHPNSKVSGSLFINVDQNSSKLHLYNPNPYIKYEDYDKVTDCSAVDFEIQPTNGQLILFPSWLEHGSDEQKNNTDQRVVISFNCNFYRSK